MTDVIIAGGGISALSAAWKIKQNGHSFTLLEKSPDLGGNVRTLEKNHFRYETGPHSFMGSSEYMWRLIQDLHMEKDVEQAAPVSNNRYIYRDGQIMALPMSASAFIRTHLLSWKGKLRLMMEPFIPNGADPADTAWDYFVRRFGTEAATYMMSPFISGVYAGNVHQLGAMCAFPKFWNFERDHGSMIIGAMVFMYRKKHRLKREGLPYRKGLFSFHGGLGRLTERLHDELKPGIISNAPVLDLRVENGRKTLITADASHTAATVVLATPPQETARILKSSFPQAAQLLEAIPMAPVTVVHWTHPETRPPLPRGFGFLVPRHFKLETLGTLFPAGLFQNRAPAGQNLFASFYGGMTNPQGADLPDSQLEAIVKKEHAQFFGQPLPDIKIIDILRYPCAIPQLLPDHTDRISRVFQVLKEEAGIILAGNYLTGVGIEHAAHSGYAAAELCDHHIKTIPSGETETA